MGFIEDERRRAAKELKEQQRSKSMLEQRERDRKQREVSKALTEAAKYAAQKVAMERSKQQFEQSGLGGMIMELGKLGSHKEATKRCIWRSS